MRDKIAQIFNTVILPDDDLRQVFEDMDRQGRLDFKKVTELIVMLVEHLEDKK